MSSLMQWSTLGPILVILFGAIGTYLMLPHRHGWAKPRSIQLAGACLAGLAILLLVTLLPAPGPFLTSLFFYAFSLTAVIGGLLMITSRNPVYSALWFAAVVLATSGLFLLSGAPFLAAGTVIVYAGAIIVTFLFVIMLAQSEGHAAYDRAARSPAAATLTSFLLLWCLLYSLQTTRNPEVNAGAKVDATVIRPEPVNELIARHKLGADEPAARVLDRAIRPTARFAPSADPKTPTAPSVAALGGTLYTDHLIAVEVAGAILFVALIAAASIATPRLPVRPGDVVRAAGPLPTSTTPQL